MRTWANVAELTKAKTLSGGLLARPTQGLPFLLHEGLEVAFVPPQLDTPRCARVTSVSESSKGAYLVCFDSVETIEVAERLVGCCCLVRRDELPKEALATEADALVGFEVHDTRTGYIGIVGELTENPAHPLLSVTRAEGEEPVLIPLVDAFVETIDEECHRITTTLPEGLLDL